MSSADAATERGRPPGRPRSPEADEAILVAALEVLVDDGYKALSMEAVRVRAGVGKATLYRRWSGKRDLVAAAIERLGASFDAPPDTGSLRTDFMEMVMRAAQTTYSPAQAAFMPRLMAESVADDELHELFFARLVEPRRRIVHDLVDRAVARGEVRADLDREVVVDVLAGPLIYLVIISGGRLERLGRQPLAHFDAVYRGIAAR